MPGAGQAEEETPTAPSTWREQYVKGLALGFGILAGSGGAGVIAWRIYLTRHPRRRHGSVRMELPVQKVLVLVYLLAHLEIQAITARDTMALGSLGDRKQAIFCIIPDSNDNSLNFLVGILYTQAFQELYYQADKCEKACPQHLPIRELLQDVTAEFEK